MGWIIVIIVVLFLIGSANSKKQPQTKAAKWNDPNLERVRKIEVDVLHPDQSGGKTIYNVEPTAGSDRYSFFIDSKIYFTPGTKVLSVRLFDSSGQEISMTPYRWNISSHDYGNGLSWDGYSYLIVYPKNQG